MGKKGPVFVKAVLVPQFKDSIILLNSRIKERYSVRQGMMVLQADLPPAIPPVPAFAKQVEVQS